MEKNKIIGIVSKYQDWLYHVENGDTIKGFYEFLIGGLESDGFIDIWSDIHISVVNSWKYNVLRCNFTDGLLEFITGNNA